jgi:hypothetical protein
MMQPHELSNKGQEVFKLIEFDKDEELIAEIRKHPIGLFIIYFTGFFVAFIVLGATLVSSRFLDRDILETGTDLTKFRPFIAIAGLLLAGFSVLLTLVAAYLYKSNVILVSSEKIAQILNPSIFNRKISQLSIGDVQDATVSQKGLLARLFNYGTITIETAGEQQNLNFTFTP